MRSEDYGPGANVQRRERPTVLSLFSGVGGFDLGLERAGFEVVAQCDNDAFCNKVLAKHWPEVRRYTDVRDIRVGCWPVGSGEGDDPVDDRGIAAIDRQPRYVDLVCGGFPCQDLSVAGKRAGLAGDRSGLWFEFHRILSELRPAFALIENVPGLLSSNEGRDFAVILRGLGELGYVCGWAVLDSQHFGVPQRRRRVYVVAGPTRESVQQILSLCEGGDWHPQKGRAAGEEVARPLGASATSFGGWRGDLDHETYIPHLAASLTTDDGNTGRRMEEGQVVAFGGNRTGGPLEVAAALQAHGGPNGRQDFGSETFLLAHTLSADGFDASEDGTGRGTPLVAFSNRGNDTGQIGETLRAGSHGAMPMASTSASVRRLTPVECERLQGFPDGWTDLGNTPDGPRYKAMGNAVSVPVIEYLGRRIMEVLNALSTPVL
jgi:DNA (cytosine-5)-methyltransferase 1